MLRHGHIQKTLKNVCFSGKYVIPGGVDPSTHLLRGLGAAPLAEDLAASTRAAVAGGTTTLVDLVLPERGESLLEAHAAWKVGVEESTCCDVVLSVAVPELTEERLAEMETLAKETTRY
jgi:dihydropyrimidinase